MTDRHATRREKLLRGLRPEGVDALLVSALTNVAYLTGFSGSSAALIVAPDRALIVSDGRYEAQLRDECPGLEHHIRPAGQPLLEGVAEVLNRLKYPRLGVEAHALTVADFDGLRGAVGATELKGLTGLVEALRAVKDRQEIEAIRAAVGMAERAFDMLRAGLRPQDSEKDAADAMEGYLRRCGATASAFPTIVAVGPRAALPHAHPTAGTRLGDGELLLVDWGADGGPYKSDLTRVLVAGKVSAKFAKVYRTVLAAQERAIRAIRPGAEARAIDAEARSVIEEAGFGRFFDHGTGHGLGMDIHEAPFLRRQATETLRAGMVLTVEPGIYLPGWGGIRVEDDVLVTPDGGEVLTRVPRTLDSVRY